MSAAKRRKVSCEEVGTAGGGSDQPAACKPEILVDLGNGVCGHLRTEGPHDAIVEERWRKFKAELHKSEFWQQYKERSNSPSLGIDKKAYKEIIEREIQRAWDESGKVESLRLPDHGRSGDVGNVSSHSEGEVARKISDSESAGEEKSRGMAQSGRMQRYLVTVEYAGTRFLGWQKQKNRPDLRTVQGILEDAFHKFIGQPVVCGGSSRTDTGVHALANVCHIDAERVSKRKPGEYLPPHEPEVVKRAVNHFLQKDAGGDMMITNVRCVPPDFHARFQARERTYHYRIIAGNPSPSIFERDRAWNVPEILDLPAMQEAAQELIGHHDFSSFRAAGCQAKSPVKTLDELHICEMPAWPCFPSLEERVPYCRQARTDVEDDPKKNQQIASKSSPAGDCFVSKSSRPRCYVITARARSFLYHQVRLLVGTLKAVGCGVLTRQDGCGAPCFHECGEFYMLDQSKRRRQWRPLLASILPRSSTILKILERGRLQQCIASRHNC